MRVNQDFPSWHGRCSLIYVGLERHAPSVSQDGRLEAKQFPPLTCQPGQRISEAGDGGAVRWGSEKPPAYFPQQNRSHFWRKEAAPEKERPLIILSSTCLLPNNLGNCFNSNCG